MTKYEAPPVHFGKDDRLERAAPDPAFLDSKPAHAWTPNQGSGGKWHHRVFEVTLVKLKSIFAPGGEA